MHVHSLWNIATHTPMWDPLVQVSYIYKVSPYETMFTFNFRMAALEVEEEKNL